MSTIDTFCTGLPFTLILILLSTHVLSTVFAQNVSIDVDSNFSIPNTTAYTTTDNIVPVNTKGIPLNAFKTSRQGDLFEVSLSLTSGSYDLDLGFAESQFCYKSGRVFHIYISDELIQESFDIYRAAGGCNRSYVESISGLSISTLLARPIVIKMVSVSGKASLSYIRVLSSKRQCIPVTNDARKNDVHLAHSIPGIYEPVVDHDGDQFEILQLDGRESHTHFSYSEGSGRITAFKWSLVETGEVISTDAVFRFKFPLGTTRVRLTVTDDACSQHSDETTITVTTTLLPGQYCYFYPYNAETNNLPPQTLWRVPRPVSSAISSSSKVQFPSSNLIQKMFVMRCIFLVQFKEVTTYEISIDTADSGIARVYKGKDVILDTRSKSVSSPDKAPEGYQTFEVIYTRADTGKAPIVDLKIDGKHFHNIFYDQIYVVPIISSIDPGSGSMEGGTNIRVQGYGLHSPLKVWFGKKYVLARRAGSTERQALVFAPSAKEPGKVPVYVESKSGARSKSIHYTYGNTCDDVSFDSANLTTNQNKNLDLNQPTSVALGNDNCLYIGTRLGIIHVVTYDAKTLKASDVCSSEKFRDPRYKDMEGRMAKREILGITFDPRDKTPRPYVSVSTTYWNQNSHIDPSNKRAWANGAVERFKPATTATRQQNPSQCLEHDRNIVQNLPVSDADHSINELLFDHNGDLLITVGGNTNMGLPGRKFGGLWESYFSASVVIAHLSRGSKYNGTISYTSFDNVHTAHPNSNYTDVSLYAMGFRNLFSLTMARNGRIYGIDMGPNSLYGNASIDCSQYKKDIGSKSVDFVPGLVSIDPYRKGERKFGPPRGDKLVEVKRGKYYGHPNIVRALMTNELGECSWIDPLTAKPAGNTGTPSNYEHYLSYFQSAKTGIQEYGSAHFCGRLRGNLVMSKYKGDGSFRVRVNNGGIPKVLGIPHRFAAKSGLRVVENVHGHLLFPQYTGERGIIVQRPRVKSNSKLYIVNALPFRHGKQGGTTLTVGGSGFKHGARVSIGEKNCLIKRISAWEIQCTVPPMKGGSHVSLTIRLGLQNRTLDGAVLYMEV